MKARWTKEAVQALGLTTDLQTATSIAGFGYTSGKVMAREGTLPFPAYRVGHKWIVPTAGLLRLLGLAEETTTEEAATSVARLEAVQ